MCCKYYEMKSNLLSLLWEEMSTLLETIQMPRDKRSCQKVAHKNDIKSVLVIVIYSKTAQNIKFADILK